jgi:hypothetical protein
VKATLMLCDFAQVAEGKLFISGGGWSYTNVLHGHIAVLFKVGWDEANHRITAAFSLLDTDGAAIPFGDEQQNQVTVVLEVGRPAGLPRGTDLDVPIAVPLPNVQLNPGQYEWVLHVDGHTEDHWRLPFLIIPPPPQTPFPSFPR